MRMFVFECVCMLEGVQRAVNYVISLKTTQYRRVNWFVKKTTTNSFFFKEHNKLEKQEFSNGYYTDKLRMFM